MAGAAIGTIAAVLFLIGVKMLHENKAEELPRSSGGSKHFDDNGKEITREEHKVQQSKRAEHLLPTRHGPIDEFLLKDGTRCVVVNAAAITCDWRAKQ